MIPEKLIKIIDLLKTKTINKQAIWNKASGGDQFKLSISEGSAITINYWTNNYGNEDIYEVVIFNSNGDAIERFSTDYVGTTEEDVALLQKFHKAASDSYYKVEETMDALLESIMHQDIIGNNENSIPGEPEDDDLPF
jgi:hypothetical protein